MIEGVCDPKLVKVGWVLGSASCVMLEPNPSKVGDGCMSEILSVGEICHPTGVLVRVKRFPSVCAVLVPSVSEILVPNSSHP